MNKFSHFETESGKKVKTAQFDGYSINDRPFEGLMFQVEIQEDGSLEVHVDSKHEDYFSDFNQEKWLKIATDYAYKNDIFEDPTSGEECWLVPMDKNNKVKKNKAKPIAIGASSGVAALGRIFGTEKNEKEVKEEVKESVIGNFKPKRKFISFISAIKSAKVRLTRESAYIDGKHLSGVLEGAKFKITICDEGTVNFEVVENNSLTTNIDKPMLERLISSIGEMDVNGYAQKFVVSNLEFKDENDSRCYLEVEHQKPIDRFASILDSLKEEEPVENTLSDKGFSILDALLSSESKEELEREFEGESDEITLSEKDSEILIDSVENSKEPNDSLKSAAQSYLEESFMKMNEDKIKELKDRIENNQKEILRVKSEIKQSESKLKKVIEDTSVLETRLENMSGFDEANGWVFNVSDEQKPEDIGLSEDNRNVADKIADIMGLKKDVLFNMLTEGFYKIRIAPNDNFNGSDFEMNREVIEKLKAIDLLGDFKSTENLGEFEYRGDLNWHQIVSKMIQKGFTQEPEFDKVCKSNSYEAKWEPTNENKIK
jgi:hypothetical protein